MDQSSSSPNAPTNSWIDPESLWSRSPARRRVESRSERVHELVNRSRPTPDASTSRWTGPRIGGRVQILSQWAHELVNASSLAPNASTSWWTPRRIGGPVRSTLNASTKWWARPRIRRAIPSQSGCFHELVNRSRVTLNAFTSWWTRLRIRGRAGHFLVPLNFCRKAERPGVVESGI